ncbi:MAG: DUF4232 domain-containing protein [Solirubrobacteraceae bacterium]
MRTPPIAATVLAALALAGCGGGGGGGGGGSTTAGSHTAAARSTTTSAAASTSSTTPQTTPQTSTESAAASTAPPCRASGLSLSFLGGQGATGHGELGFALRNTGSSACSTVGYPGIQFLDGSGNALTTTPRHTTSDFFGQLPLRTLTVAVGGTVSFRLGVSHGGGSAALCQSAHGLQVIPPNDTATLRVTIPQGATECGATTVSPMQPGDSAYR